jgi:hypothetical protein
MLKENGKKMLKENGRKLRPFKPLIPRPNSPAVPGGAFVKFETSPQGEFRVVGKPIYAKPTLRR